MGRICDVSSATIGRAERVNANVLIAEPVTLELAVVNPLKVALLLQDLTLLWQFVPAASDDCVARLSADKFPDSDSRPLSFSNESDFTAVSLACTV